MISPDLPSKIDEDIDRLEQVLADADGKQQPSRAELEDLLATLKAVREAERRGGNRRFRLLKLAVTLWFRHRKKPYARFAGVLIWAGVALLGTPLWMLLAQAVFPLGDQPWWVASLAGLGLILAGVTLFTSLYLREVDSERSKLQQRFETEGFISSAIPEGFTFKDAAENIAASFERSVQWVGFGQPALLAPLRGKLVFANSCAAAITRLRDLAKEPQLIPKYEVVEQGIDVRVIAT